MLYSDLAFLAAISVWIPFLPGAETQPTLAVCFLAVTLMVPRGPSKFGALGLFAMCLFPAFAIGLLSGLPVLLNLAKYIFGPLFLCALFFAKVRMPSPGLIKAAVWLHAGLLALFIAGFRLTAIWPRHEIYPTRAAFLAHEPSYAATYLFVILLAVIFGLKENRRFYGAIVVACMLATQSLLGMLYLLVGAALYVRKAFKWSPVLVIAVMASSALIDNESRIGQFQDALLGIDSADILNSIVLSEASGTTRFLINFAGMWFGLETFFGHGLGSFASDFAVALRDSTVEVFQLFASNEILKDLYAEGGESSPQSYLAGLVFEAGWTGFIGFTVFFSMTLVRICSRFDALTLAFLFALSIFLFVQSQISNPLYWYAFYLFAIMRRLCSTHRSFQASSYW